MDPALWELLSTGAGEDAQEVEAIVRLDLPDVRVPGVRIVSRFGRIATCRLRRDRILDARSHPNVLSLKAARLLGPQVEAASRSPRARDDRRRPPGLPLTGSGVVVGVVDWGCDFDNPSFKQPDGSTRLLALWDQRTTDTAPGPYPYGYGSVHQRRRIDRALASAVPYDSLGYHPADADRTGAGSHGTHVLDIAAGNGRGGGPVGIAPDAELVFVHLADRGTSGLANLGDSVRILEAVDFVARIADRRPWVVNLSIGRHGGPHNGRTLTEMALDALLGCRPGRFVVQSAGNYFASSTHASGRLTPGGVESFTFVTDAADLTPNELEVWYAGQDELAVSISSPTGVRTSAVLLGDRSDILEAGRVVGRVYHRAEDPNSHDNHVDLFLYPMAPAGRWTVTLQARRIVDGAFHAWLERDEACASCQVRFTTADADTRLTTGTIANGHLPLVVGAYDAHSPARPLSPFSSSGPTRDGRVKPDLLAPGVGILAARSAPAGSRRSRGLVVRKSGTSMAAPHVTGTVALCLEAGVLAADDIRAVLLGTTEPAATPDERTGRGYLDVARATAAAMAAAQRHAPRSRPYPLPGVTPPNDSEEADMEVEQAYETVAALGPSRVYRELLYRPGGSVASWLDGRFDVVARPGEAPSTRPVAGDLLVRVALGEPGEGHVGVLSGSHHEVLDRTGRVPLGDLLLRPRPLADWLGEEEQTRDRVTSPLDDQELAGPGRDLASLLGDGAATATRRLAPPMAVIGSSRTRPATPTEDLTESPDDTSGDFLSSPPSVRLTVDRMGVTVVPPTSARFDPGRQRFHQVVSMLLKALVGSAYRPELAREAVEIHTLHPLGDLVGVAGPDETVQPARIVTAALALRIIEWLEGSKQLRVFLSADLQRRLEHAYAVERAWSAVVATAGETPTVSGPPASTYPWITPELFIGIAWHQADLVEAIRAGLFPGSNSVPPPIVAPIMALWARFQEAAEPLEAVRTDPALVAHPAVRYALFPDSAVGTALQPQRWVNGRARARFLEVCIGRFSHLRAAALAGTEGRKALLDRFADDLAIALTALNTQDGEDLLRNEVAVANAMGFPARLRTTPVIGPPTFAHPSGTELFCEMLVEYPEWTDAFGALYKWDVLRLDGLEWKETGGATFGARLGRRLERQAEYTWVDYQRLRCEIEGTLGGPGLASVSIAQTLALIRFVGTVISSVLQAIVEKPHETTVTLGPPGIYMIRCISYRTPTDEAIRRIPSAAYQIVIALAPEDLARRLAAGELEAAADAARELTELEAALAGQTPLTPEERTSIEQQLPSLQTAVRGSIGDRLAAQRATLERQRTAPPAGSELAVNPAAAVKQITDRIEEIDVIIPLRTRRLAGVPGVPEPLVTILVTDVGPTMYLAVELVELTAAASGVEVLVVDSTTKKSGSGRAHGADRGEAVRRSLLALLEADTTGYGRGVCCIAVPITGGVGASHHQTLTFRVERDVGALVVEAIEGAVTLLAVVALVAAPFTGGASLAIMIPIGIIGLVPTAYRWTQRGSQGTFRWELQTALELVDVVGAFFGGARAGLGALRMVRLAKGFMILGHGANGLGVILGHELFFRQIEAISADTSLAGGQKRAALMMAVANQLLSNGVAAGHSLAERAYREMDVHGVDRNRFPLDVAPLSEPLPAVDRARTTTVALPAAPAPLRARARAVAGRDVPVFVDPALDNDSALVRYRLDNLGFVDEVYIVVGTRAGAVQIGAHAEVAKQMLRFTGIIGKARDLIDWARALVTGRPDLRVGSRAWEARLELEKLPRQLTDYMDAAPERLRRGELTDADIGAYVRAIQEQLDRHERSLYADSRGRGYVAALGAGTHERFQRVVDLAAPKLGVSRERIEVAVAPASQRHVSVVAPESANGPYTVRAPAAATDADVLDAVEAHADLARRRGTESWTARDEARYRGYPDPEDSDHYWRRSGDRLLYVGIPRKRYDPSTGTFVDDEPPPRPGRRPSGGSRRRQVRIPRAQVVLRAVLTFNKDASEVLAYLQRVEAAIARRSGLPAPPPPTFRAYVIPRSAGDAAGDPIGLHRAIPVGVPPSTQGRFGVLLLEPPAGSKQIHLVSWNSGDPARLTNDSHAERFFLEWFDPNRLPGLQQLDLRLTLSPCTHCARMLSAIDRRDFGASLDFVRPYASEDRHGILVDNATTREDLAPLKSKGWDIPSDVDLTDVRKKQEIDQATQRHVQRGFTPPLGDVAARGSPAQPGGRR